eukprot:7336008-Prymnesium_polylepis.1
MLFRTVRVSGKNVNSSFRGIALRGASSLAGLFGSHTLLDGAARMRDERDALEQGRELPILCEKRAQMERAVFSMSDGTCVSRATF